MKSPVILLPLVPLLAAAFVYCVRRPTRTILPVYAATLPIASVVTLHVPLPDKFNTLSSALGGATILAALLHVAIYRRIRPPSIPVIGWLAYLAWITLTALWAIDPGGTVSALGIAWSLVGLLVVVSILPTDDVDVDVLRVALIVSGLVVGVYAFFLIVSGKQLPAHGVNHRLSIAATASDTDPNILAASLLVPMLLSVERMLLGGRRWWRSATWRTLGAAGAFFSFLAIVFTASRGGLLAGLVAFVMCLVYCRRFPDARNMTRRLIEAIVVVSLGVGFVFAIRPQTTSSEPVQRILGSASLDRITSSDTSGSGRIGIWITGYRACLSSCAWGVGHSDFPDVYNSLFALSGAETDIGPNRPAHDIYVQAAVEDGFIGLGLLFLALALEWWALRSAWMRTVLPSGRSLLVAILVANVFLSALWFKYFWLVFVLFRVVEGAEPANAPLEGADLAAATDIPVVSIVSRDAVAAPALT